VTCERETVDAGTQWSEMDATMHTNHLGFLPFPQQRALHNNVTARVGSTGVIPSTLGWQWCWRASVHPLLVMYDSKITTHV